jgi:D-3-phosphoglycerate dehydrogenase
MQKIKDCRVLVTTTSFGKDDASQRAYLESQVGVVEYNTVGRPMTSEELQKVLLDKDGVIAGLDQFDRSALQAAKNLKVVARYGVGYDRVDVDVARELGIIVTYTPGANSVSVAELTIGLMLGLARNIPNASAQTKKGDWPRFSGVSIYGKTVGILGLGAIGKVVALMLKNFGCKTLAYDPYPDQDFAKKNNIQIVGIEDMLSQSEFISLHMPVTSETKGMVNREFIGKMKKGAFLINTARGELVDESALVEALQSGQLRGAGLDVFSPEPPSPDSPLLKLENVILTPHMGAHADSATIAMGAMAMADCLSVLQNKDPLHPIPKH